MIIYYSKNLHKWFLKFLFMLWICGELIECAAKIKKRALTESILHYETLNYPKKYLSDGHTRVRKSLDPRELLHLNFRAHSRNFDLRLQRDNSIFSDGLSFDHESFQPSNIYKGHLHDDPKSRVHGFIFDDIFEGRIHCGDGNEFHVESAKQYKHINHTSDVHSVIYNTKDIVMPENHVCGGVKANVKHWMETQTNGTHHSEKPDYIKYGQPLNPFPQHPEVHHRQRRAFDKDKTECRMLLRADYTFAKWAGSNERAMYMLTQYVSSVSHIYQGTDFNQNDGTTTIPQEITLKIKRISIIPKCTDLGKTDCEFSKENIGVGKFLDLASLDNHDEYCLAYVFAHRDFAQGVLGLAWIGDPTGAGGICDRYQSIQGTKKSLNTGIVTNLNYGNVMSSKVTEITFAHEVGHNFGSQHDPAGTCSPGSSGGGNFIMYAKATSGSDTNNFRFSSCTKNDVWPVLLARSPICFNKNGDPICGNRIKEQGEECDCGYKGEDGCVKDQCCEASDTSQNSNPGCKLSNKAKLAGPTKCSSSSGLCCDTAVCKPYATSVNKECSASSECAAASTCVSSSYKCPDPVQKPNITTLCNNASNVCFNGECTGSVCLRDGREPCQCSAEANYCKICCQEVNKTSTCGAIKVSGLEKYLHSGSPCNNYVGYCDFLNKCRKVDAEGPLSRLKELLFSSDSIDNILDWMKTYWWACVLIGLGLVLFMAAFIACCSVHTPSSNPNKPAPRHLSLPRTMSRRNRGAATAPPESSGYHRQPQPEQPDQPPGYETALREKHQGYEMR